MTTTGLDSGEQVVFICTIHRDLQLDSLAWLSQDLGLLGHKLDLHVVFASFEHGKDRRNKVHSSALNLLSLLCHDLNHILVEYGEEELKVFVFYNIDADDSCLLKMERGRTPIVLEIVNTVELNVIEVLLC